MLFSANLLFLAASCFIFVSAYQYDDQRPFNENADNQYDDQQQRSLWDFNLPENHRLIIEGRVPNRHELPYMAFVRRIYNNTAFTCSGSILGPKYILTARHCVGSIDDNPVAITVNVGSQYRSNGQKYFVQNIYPHDNPQVDLVILKLADYIILDNRNLASVRLSSRRPKSGETLTAAGFGIHWNKKKEVLDERSYVIGTMEVMEDCPWQLPDYVFCAGGLNRGTSPGDSGGPVMAYVNGRLCQVGITIAGTDPNKVDGGINSIGVYYTIGPFCDFIEDKTDGKVWCY